MSGADRREEVVEGARAIFYREGFAKVSLNRICREKGIKTEDAGEEDRRAAAAWVLDELLKLKRPKRFEELTAGKSGLQIGIERVILEDGVIRNERTVLAEVSL